MYAIKPNIAAKIKHPAITATVIPKLVPITSGESAAHAPRMMLNILINPVNFFISLSPFLLVLFNLVFVFFNVLD